MVTAYVMIKVLTGEADRIRDEISNIDNILDVHIVAGDIDLIAKVDVDTPGSVKQIVADQIRSVTGVDNTQTYIAMD